MQQSHRTHHITWHHCNVMTSIIWLDHGTISNDYCSTGAAEQGGQGGNCPPPPPPILLGSDVHGKYVYSTLYSIQEREIKKRDSLKKGERSGMLLCTAVQGCL